MSRGVHRDSRQALWSLSSGSGLFRRIWKQCVVERSSNHLFPCCVDRTHDLLRNDSIHAWIRHERDDVVVQAERKHLTGEVSCLDGSGYEKKCVRKIDDYTSKRMIRVDVILICIRSNDAYVFRFLHRLEHAKPGSVGILKNDIDTARDLC